MNHTRVLLLLSTLVSLCLLPTGVGAQEDAATPPLTVAEVLVEPSSPKADTLCTLRVKIGNTGSQIASQLGFKVLLNGEELPVYGNQLFMYPVDPGTTAEIPLYNFWTTESSRPETPKDGKMKVEVVITEAQWMTVEMIDEVETWTPQGAVPGLPAKAEVTLTLAP